MLSTAQQQPWGIVPVPDPVDSPLHLVGRHFIEPIPGQEVGRRKHPSCACFVCNVTKRHCQMLVWGTVINPKSSPLTGCSICKRTLCIDPIFKLYHTEKDFTSEIIKIARMSVKPIQKDAQHVQTDAQHV